MNCSSCGRRNRAEARFCDQCGGSIAAAPAATKQVSGTDRSVRPSQSSVDSAPERRAYTPKHLTDKVLRHRAALEGERKQVTVLFADVKGSMELAEQIDPEEWHEIMDKMFVILAAAVHRFEGTVNQYTGDGIMALFGAPIAHEDHARRACLAALALREELGRYGDALRLSTGLNFSVRMGLNSGEVVVGKIGDDLRMDYTAMGHTVGIAARMEQIAAPGQVYLADATAELVRGFFRFRSIGPCRVKGVTEPLVVYELQELGEARTRLDLSRARGLSGFVGRDVEMEGLEDALEQVIGGGGQVVNIVGEAGTGKSRLCCELVERCRLRGVAVFQTHGVAHGASIPLLPVLDLLRDLLGLTTEDTPSVVRTKISGTLLMLDDQFRGDLPVLFELLGNVGALSETPRPDRESRQRTLFDVIVRFVGALCGQHPVVLVIDDLHWFDRDSLAVLGALAEAAPQMALLLLFNFRPECQPVWLECSFSRTLRLHPLGPAETDQLLDGLVGAGPSLGDLPERIRERAGGNPFFIEEMVRALVQSGRLVGEKGSYRLIGLADQVVIPDSVQALLAARLDRLPEAEKSLLQIAAVVGKRFSESLLRLVSPGMDILALLPPLIDAELLVEELAPVAPEFTFRHPLTHEVAYTSLLRDRRKELHAAVALATAQLAPDRSDEQAAWIAHHWEQAGDWWEAAQWNRRAASWVAGTNAVTSMELLRKVLELIERVASSQDTKALGFETRLSILRVGGLVGISSEEAAQVFAEAKVLAEEQEDQHSLAGLVSTYGNLRMMSGQVIAAHAYAEAASALAGDVGGPDLQASLRLDEAQTTLWTGRPRGALRLADEALAGFRGGPQSDERGISVGLGAEAFAMALRGICLSLLGRSREAVDELDRTIAAARSEGGREGLCIALGFRALVAHVMEDAPAALVSARSAAEIAAETKTPFLFAMSRTNLGVALVLDGAHDEGRQVLGDVLQEGAASARGTLFEGFALVSLVRAELAAGHAKRAAETALTAVEIVTGRGERITQCFAEIIRVHAELAAHGVAGVAVARAGLAHVERLVHETEAVAFRPRLHLEAACLAAVEGDRETQRSELAEAERLAREMDMPGLAAVALAARDGGSESA